MVVASKSATKVQIAEAEFKIMKRLLLLIAAAAVCSPLYADVIQDTYIGGDDHGYGDVIADPGDNRFDVSSMVVNLVGTTLTVTVNISYEIR